MTLEELDKDINKKIAEKRGGAEMKKSSLLKMKNLLDILFLN